MDYGPFSTHEIETMIESGELSADSELANYRSRTSAPINQIPYFIDFIEDKIERDAKAKHEAEVAHDHHVIHTKAKRSHRIPLILGGVIVVASIAGAWYLLREPVAAKSGYPVAFFRDLTIPLLKPMKATLSSPVVIEAEEAKAAVNGNGGAGNGRKRQPATGISARAAGVIPAPELDFSFGDEAGAATRDLTREDLDVLKQSVTPGLVGCFQKEAAQDREFRGGKVVFYVMPKGKVALSKVETTPPADAGLVSCITSTVNSKKIAPYNGDIQIIEIPMHVSAVN
jgi:hypothetical protein